MITRLPRDHRMPNFQFLLRARLQKVPPLIHIWYRTGLIVARYNELEFFHLKADKSNTSSAKITCNHIYERLCPGHPISTLRNLIYDWQLILMVCCGRRSVTMSAKTVLAWFDSPHQPTFICPHQNLVNIIWPVYILINGFFNLFLRAVPRLWNVFFSLQKKKGGGLNWK